MRAKKIVGGALLSFLFFVTSGGAWADIPLCRGFDHKELPVDNEQALYWKFNTKNQFKTWGHIQGRFIKVLRDRKSHIHFEVYMGDEGTDGVGSEESIELIYNKHFGQIPVPNAGDEIEACGEYITSNAPTQKYPKPSPMGAIIHWVHLNPKFPKGKPGGFVRINQKYFGLEPKAQPLILPFFFNDAAAMIWSK